MTLLQGPKNPVLPTLTNTRNNSILLKGENYSGKLKVCEPFTFFYDIIDLILSRKSQNSNQLLATQLSNG